MTDCPSTARLDEWASDRLPPDERAALARHVADCPRCQAVLRPPAPPDGPGGPPPEPPPDVPGYEVLGLLGRGGMGVVYRARHLALDRVVALKVVAAPDPAARARFAAEARAAARLRHPGIVQVHEAGEAGGVAYFSMECVDGGSVADGLDGRPRPPRAAAGLVRAVAGAVGFAHAHGVVHRDVKPANVLLTPDGAPKLADFGVAKQLGAADGQTRTGDVVGTPRYMAPEQAAGRVKEVGPATDVYALGVVLYELLTGRPPHLGADTVETLEFVRAQDPVPPRRLVPDVPPALEAVCLRCLEKDPGRRYPTAADLAADLDRFLRGDPVAARPAGPLGQLAAALGRGGHDRPLRAWGTAVVALAPVVGVPTMAVTGLALWAPALVRYVPAVGLGVVGASLAAAWWLRRYRLRDGVGPAVRQFQAVLDAHALAVAAVLAAALLMFDAADPLELLKLGPYVAIVTGQMYYALGAAYWGRFYVAGVACLGVGVLAAAAPVWGPLGFGLLLTLVFAAWGLHLRRLGAEPE